ncbi:MAG: hypothetical protein LBG95_05140 [Treponema sp.]|jgi:hypothetical protein|nr:hypothetical protein [Treponema sp.]
MKPEKNRGKSSAEMPPLKERQKEFAASLEAYTVELLRNVYKSLIGKAPLVKKAELIQMLTSALIFEAEDSFRQWFDFLPSLTQNVLTRLMFTEFLPVSVLEEEFNKVFLVKDGGYSWNRRLRLSENLNLDFLSLDRCNGNYALGLPEFLRKAFSGWLEPPPEIDIANCVSEEAGPGWDNSQLIADSYPLLCDAVKQLFAGFPDAEKEKAAKGFNKKQRAELRDSSGFLDFDMDHAYCPDSMDLALRFMLCMKNFNPLRPQDAHDDIREIVTRFFSADSRYKKSWFYPDRNYLEVNVCIDHLGKTQGYYPDYDDQLPLSRKSFHEILVEIAKDGRRFDTDKLAEHIKAAAKKFSFCGRDFERSLKIKASMLDAGGITYSCDSYDDFRVMGILRYDMLVRPLLKAYCYIFAALGLLEITQQMPSLALTKAAKKFPLSPYDSLKTIRITQFGLWCLGLSSKKPPKPSHEYQAIADKELLLVTVQGISLERTLYLNKIGVKLGEDRWRVSPASFIAGCESTKQIEDRIARFKTLIDPAPAPHWLELFDKAVSRAGLFGRHRNDMLVYSLPENQKITEELLWDPELKGIALRAEGGMLLVPAKNQKKFFALLSEHGIASF